MNNSHLKTILVFKIKPLIISNLIEINRDSMLILFRDEHRFYIPFIIFIYIFAFIYTIIIKEELSFLYIIMILIVID
jgi:hypothetical protein